jgi:hypothetical protein
MAPLTGIFLGRRLETTAFTNGRAPSQQITFFKLPRIVTWHVSEPAFFPVDTNTGPGFVCILLSASCVRSDYADPLRPDCHADADGVSCNDKGVESCSSALGLSITTVDRSVHVT